MTTAPAPLSAHVDLAGLLTRAEQAVTAQGDAYGTATDPDGMSRCAWNTWRALTDLIPAARALLNQPPTPTSPGTLRHLTPVPDAA